MLDELPFKLDTNGDNELRLNNLFYVTNGNIEDNLNDSTSKPSQERPLILKQKAKRYHEQANDKIYTPGKLSFQLRKALGLRFSELPEHIYRMRHLGYPPGWLKRAEVKNDNISITGAHSVVNASRSTSVKYDWEKLYEFPGFNTYKNYDQTFDRSTELGFMSIQQNTLLENFLTFLSDQRMLGKEATNMKDIRSRNVIHSGTDFNLPISPMVRPVASSTPKQSRKRVKSKLIDKMNSKENDTRAIVVNSGSDLSDGEVEDDDDDGDDDDVIIIDDPAVKNNQLQSNQSMTTKTENGTYLLVPPVIKPTLDRFSEGINDHRLFENLPNIGGTYKKVLNVLKRIQS